MAQDALQHHQTVATKPTFRNAFRRRRCLVAADGLYEWKRLERTKQPYFISLRDGQPFAFAGLWEYWEQDGQVIDSCAIIMTEANQLTRSIHDRMPVILALRITTPGLDPELRDPERLKAFLKPHPSERMRAHPVSTAVNNPKSDRPELIAGT